MTPPLSNGALCYKDVEYGGSAVGGSGNSVSFGAPAGSTFSRSEGIWGAGSGCVNGAVGQTVTWTFTSRLSAGMSSADGWQVISQLHGPSRNGMWYGPAVALVVEDGYWKVSGGWQAPDGRGGMTGSTGYATRMARAVDNVNVTWTITVLMGGPGVGTVTVVKDGQTIVNAYQPGAGTTYSGYGVQDHVYQQVKTGLYADVSARTSAATVTISNFQISCK